MKITRTSMFTGEVHTMDIPVTQEQLDRIDRGELIQNVLPHLSADQREFIKTGVTPDEWEKYMGSEDEEEYDDGYDNLS